MSILFIAIFLANRIVPGIQKCFISTEEKHVYPIGFLMVIVAKRH